MTCTLAAREYLPAFADYRNNLATRCRMYLRNTAIAEGRWTAAP